MPGLSPGWDLTWHGWDGDGTQPPSYIDDSRLHMDGQKKGEEEGENDKKIIRRQKRKIIAVCHVLGPSSSSNSIWLAKRK